MADKIKKVIELQSVFDPQGIIDGLKQMQKALGDAGKTEPKILGSFNTTLNQAQGKVSAMQEMLRKGLTTEKDVDAFKNITKSIESSLQSAIQLMTTLSGEGLLKASDNLEKSTRTTISQLKKEAEGIIPQILAAFKSPGGRAITGTIEGIEKQIKAGISFEDLASQLRAEIATKKQSLPEVIDTKAARKELDNLRRRQLTLQESLIQKEQEKERLSKERLQTEQRIAEIQSKSGPLDFSNIKAMLVKGNFSDNQIQQLLSRTLPTVLQSGDITKLLENFSKMSTGFQGNPTIGKQFVSRMSNEEKLRLDEELRNLYNLNNSTSTISAAQQRLQALQQAEAGLAQQIEQTKTVIKGQQEQIDKLTSSIENNANAKKKQRAVDDKSTALEAALQKAEAPFKEYSKKVQEIKDAQTNLTTKTNENKAAINNNAQTLKQYTDSLGNGVRAVKQFSLSTAQNLRIQGDVEATFNRLMYRLQYFFSIFTVYRTLSKQIRQTYNDLQNLDKAFGSIAMVTSKSVNDLWSSYSQYADIANRLGQTTESAIKTSALFYQQGLDTADVLKLTESTMKLATLAGQDFETSTKQLTAALRAFHMEMEQGEHVTDVYSELAAHAAADVSGIADAMSKVASIASSAGASFENISAFLTQIIETTQEGGVNAGTALKTIIARFTELKENVDDAEESFEDLDYNKIDKALKTVGINLKDDAGQIRNFDDIIIELSGIWDTLSRNQQRYIATVAAGSRQQSRFIALLEDHERLMELIEVAEDSAGRSTQQFAKYADTIEYKVATLKNTWEQFRISLLNEKTVKKFLEGTTNGLKKVVDFNWLDWAGVGATFLLLGKTVGRSFLTGFKNVTLLGMRGINLIGNAFPMLIQGVSPKASEQAQALRGLQSYSEMGWYGKKLTPKQADILNSWQGGAGDNLPANKSLTNEQGERASQLWQKESALQTAKFQAYGATAATSIMVGFSSVLMRDNPGEVFLDTFKIGLASSAMQGLTVAMAAAGRGLGVAFTEGLAATGIGVAITVAIAGISALIKKAINESNKAIEDAAKAMSKSYAAMSMKKQIIEEQKELQKNLAELESQAEKTTDAYEELKKKGERIKELQSYAALTIEQQEELNTLSNEMADLYPSLVARYTSEGNAVIDLKNKYEELIKVKKEEARLDQIKLKKGALDNALEDYLEVFTDNIQKEGHLEYIQNDWIQALLGNKSYEVIVDDNGKTEKITGVMPVLEKLSNPDIYTGITGAEKIDAGEFFQGILSENPFFNELNTETDLKKYMDKLYAKAKQYEKEGNQMAINSVAEAIKAYQVNNIVLDESKKKAEEAVQKAYLEYLGLGVEESSLYDESSPEVQRIMLAYASEISGVDFDEIIEKWKEELQKQGIKETDIDSSIPILKNIFSTMTEGLGDASHALDDFPLEKWNEILSGVPEGLTVGQTLHYLVGNGTFSDENEKFNNLKAFVDANKSIIEAENERADALAKITGKRLDEGAGWADQLVWHTFDPFINMLMRSPDFADRFIDTYNNLSDSSPTAASLFRKNIVNMASKLSEKDFLTLVNAPWDKFDLINEDEFWDAIAKDLDNPEGLSEKIKETLKRYFTENTIIDDDVLEAVDTKYDELVKTNISSFEKAMTSFIEDGFMDAESLKALRKAGAPIQKFINDDLTPNEEEMTKWITSQINELDELKIKLKENRDLRLKDLDIITQISENSWEEVKARAELLNLNKEDIAFLEGRWSKNAKKNMDTIAELKNQILDAASDSAIDEYVASLADAAWGALEATLKTIDEKRKKNVEDIEKANKEVEDSYQSLLEKQQDLIDKQKDLNETLYGSATYKNSLDPLYNYQTAIDALQESIDELKESLDDLDGRNPSELLDQLFEKTHAKGAQLTAQNNRYRAAIDSIESMLTNELAQYLASSGHGFDTNVSDYFAYNALGDFYEVNQDAINSARMNDELKNFISDQVNQMNDYLKSIRSNNKELKKVEQEFKEYQKKVRDDYISIQDEVVEKLKDSYQKEIDDKKEMYDALKEADDDYLDALEKAIDKQRKLRDRQDKWNDLSTKEKRLSLLQRDTSGANRKETQNLRKEIENDRQSLLDESVDDIVDNLKELYETQQESREAEIEYQQSVLDNANLVLEANNIMLSWKSLEDMQEWMAQHTEDFDKMSDATVEKLQEDWATMFDNIQEYNALQQKEVSDIFNFTGQEIQDIVNSTSEVLTSEASRALAETTAKVEESITSAQKAVSDAMDALSEAQTKYNEAISTYNELIGETALLTAKYRAILDEEEARRQREEEQENLLAYYKESLDHSRGVSEARDAILNEAYYRFSDLKYYWQLADYKPNYAYASGGLVDYTGPAWVDGTKQKPESFLDAEDTYRIGKAADILRDLALNNSFVQTAVPAAVESNIQITINVDSIATEDQVDYLIDRMKEEIVDSANPIGSSVILR